MNRNYQECKVAIAQIDAGIPVQRVIPSLTQKLDAQFEQTKGCIYTALPLNVLNVSLSYMEYSTSMLQNYSEPIHANTILFGVATLKWLADLTDRQRINRLVKDKYEL